MMEETYFIKSFLLLIHFYLKYLKLSPLFYMVILVYEVTS